jgi:hypothetical protein
MYMLKLLRLSIDIPYSSQQQLLFFFRYYY